MKLPERIATKLPGGGAETPEHFVHGVSVPIRRPEHDLVLGVGADGQRLTVLSSSRRRTATGITICPLELTRTIVDARPIRVNPSWLTLHVVHQGSGLDRAHPESAKDFRKLRHALFARTTRSTSQSRICSKETS